MKKRFVVLLLVLVLSLGLCPAALAYGDVIYTQDTRITAFGAEYDNVTVRAGVTVTFQLRQPDPNAIFVFKSLTVEPGGRITGPGIIGMFRGATYSGIDFYYKVQGEEVLLDQEKLDWLIEEDPENRLVFYWNEDNDHYSLLGYGFERDPFFDPNAVKDAEYTESVRLSHDLSCQWRDCIIRSGVTVSLPAEGQELHGALTVESGGRMEGNSLIFFSGASVTGLTLWYHAGDEIKPIPNNDPSPLFAGEPEDFRLFFNYDSQSDRYVLSDLFDAGRLDPAATEEGAAALRLKELGLFLGTGTDFELYRVPRRTEAIVMLIRLLGQEQDALAHAADYPYDDVPAWANRYVAYAFSTGLTNGVGNGRFGAGDATDKQFLTFVLRSLGYEDESSGGSDFSWRSPEALAQQLGLIRGEADLLRFDRGDCVLIMEQALTCPNKFQRPLWELLAEKGVFTREAYLAVYDGGERLRTS